MKRAALLFFILFFYFNSFAQTAGRPVWVAKANMLSPLVQTGSFAVEFSPNPWHGLQLGGHFTDFSAGSISVNGFGFVPEYRHYLSEEAAPEGFHIGAFLRYQRLDYTIAGLFSDREKSQTHNYGGGITIGKQWLLKNRIAVDIFAGPSYTRQHAKVETDFSDQLVSPGWFSGFGLRSGLTIGYAFGRKKVK